MRIRRRGLGEGFEALELLRARGSRPVSPFEDFQINQRGALPPRRMQEAVPPVPQGPPVTSPGFDRTRIVGMLDQPNSQIGRSIILGAGGAAVLNGASAPLIQAKCSDERARQITIFLSVENNPSAGLDRDIVGLLSWGVGGMMISGVEVDFVNGAALSLVASFLQLNVRSDAVAAATQFQVGAFLGYDAQSKVGRGPQRTIKVGAVAVATPEAVTIPRFATSFSFIRAPLTAAITLTYRDGAGGVMGIIPIAAGTDASQNKYPIPGDAMDILLTTAAADVTDGRFIFGLAL